MNFGFQVLYQRIFPFEISTIQLPFDFYSREHWVQSQTGVAGGMRDSAVKAPGVIYSRSHRVLPSEPSSLKHCSDLCIHKPFQGENNQRHNQRQAKTQNCPET